jgi:hypothetical protein
MNIKKPYPKDSLLAEMKMDILVNQQTNEVSILYDRPFQDVLTGLEIDTDKRELDFIFLNHGARPFGTAVNENIIPYLKKVEQVALFMMDMKENKPISAISMPIKVKTKG